MKKVLSVALASAMVLGMGVNAFADISYNTGVGMNEVDLGDVGLRFEGDLVIDRDDKFMTSADLDETEEGAEFRPGDVIYMPLYGDNQTVYEAKGGSKGEKSLAKVSNLKLDYLQDGKVGFNGTQITGLTVTANGVEKEGDCKVTVAKDTTLKYDDVDRAITNVRIVEKKAGDGKYYVDYLLADLAAVKGKEAKDPDTTVVTGVKEDGPYTGEIGKNWSINFTEKSENFVEKASFYKAKRADSALNTNAWYVKVELKDMFDSVDDGEVYYKVYVADNNNRETTNKVYVKGTFANDVVKYVDFEWTNNANTPAVWQVKKGENGTAVFDFEDKAFFTVKMYSEEKMYLDLSTAYQKAVAGEYDAEFDNFFKFQGTNANFSRTGELVIESNDPNLFVYEIDSDNNLYPVDAKYVKDYQITHTNDKINGYVFNTKTLGNYVLSVDKLEVEEDEAPATEAPEEKPADNNTSSNKENPNTGANDFVGVAVALAVVSVAGAGALALKK